MQEEIKSPYGNNFEDHPILSKLSTFDRIAFSAEMASEVNAVYAQGYNTALVNVGNLIREVGINGEGKFSDSTQAILYLVYNMVEKLNEHFIELYKNQGQNLAEDSA
jgi:hypothetical protein